MDALVAKPTPTAELAPAGLSPEQFFVSKLKAEQVQNETLEIVEQELAAGLVSLSTVIQRAYVAQTISEPLYLECLGKALGVEVVSELSIDDVEPAFVQAIPIGFARHHKLIVMVGDDETCIAVSNQPGDLSVICNVALWLRKPFRLALASETSIDDVINKTYSERAADFESTIQDAGQSENKLNGQRIDADTDLLDVAKRAPVVKLVNLLLFEAVKRRSSDLHIQPTTQCVKVRIRIDGVLYDFMDLPKHLGEEISSRVKVVGKMDIAEKRLAQDGRTTVAVGDREIDLRISVIPTSHGERVVIRLLDKSARLYKLPELGMAPTDHARFLDMLKFTHGIILVTGPTGSGKSTTLYSALQHLDSSEKNILTLEDPIEYQLPGISQMQVATKKGMTFATGLRAVLRQDPDVIMVGEIRDEETARMAVQSSLTGHLVFSTLHTNDAAGAVNRLLDLGMEPYLIASSLLASVAQRLVRVVCPSCCEHRDPNAEERMLIGNLHKEKECRIAIQRGCEQCAGTGYFGRQGVFELLTVNDQIRELIMLRAKTDELRNAAISAGMTTLHHDAIRKAVEGATTLEEASRVSCLY